MSKVSIAMPTYNSAKFIGKTIESILSQTYTDFIVTIIDDCSTDNTLEIIDSYKDSRIRVIKNQTNQGIKKNFDNCLRMSQDSKYCLVMCNDDLLESTYLAKKVKLLEENEEVVMVCNSTKIIDENGKLVLNRKAINEEIVDGKEALKKSLKIGNIFGEPSGVLFRTEIIDRVGFFNHDLGHAIDWEYWIRICSIGKVGFIQEYISSFRISLNSDSAKMIQHKEIIKKEHEYVTEKIYELLDKKENIISRFIRKIIFELRFTAKVVLFRINKKNVVKR